MLINNLKLILILKTALKSFTLISVRWTASHYTSEQAVLNGEINGSPVQLIKIIHQAVSIASSYNPVKLLFVVEVFG